MAGVVQQYPFTKYHCRLLREDERFEHFAAAGGAFDPNGEDGGSAADGQEGYAGLKWQH